MRKLYDIKYSESNLTFCNISIQYMKHMYISERQKNPFRPGHRKTFIRKHQHNFAGLTQNEAKTKVLPVTAYMTMSWL